MDAILERLKNEPALLTTTVAALIGLASAFGLSLTAEQTAAITAVAALVAGFVTRQVVTPTRKVGAEDVSTTGGPELEAGPASDLPDGTPVEVVESDDPKADAAHHGGELQ